MRADWSVKLLKEWEKWSMHDCTNRKAKSNRMDRLLICIMSVKRDKEGSLSLEYQRAISRVCKYWTPPIHRPETDWASPLHKPTDWTEDDDRRRWIIPKPVRYGRRRQVLYSDANRTAPKFTERDAELQSLEVFLFVRQSLLWGWAAKEMWMRERSTWNLEATVLVFIGWQMTYYFATWAFFY